MADAGFDEAHESFRNELASVHKDGRRKWVYARKPSGRYYRARTVLSWFLLAFLFLAPFVKVNGQPLLLLNLIERRFSFFGLSFWPQDFYIVVLIALSVIVTVVLSTAAVGRIWCGWLCPQTIFLEMLFRKIEWLLDGSAQQQLRQDKLPPTAGVVLRKAIKHVIFFALSFVIANVFLAYIISAEALWTIITDPPRQHIVGLVAITIFSLVFYGVFARFREQACTLACPYGRIMSAIIDRQTVTVTYDKVRGEPRGRLQRQAAGAGDAAAGPARGDCVDCGQCITVCPTGIDIRNGIQLECIACTACMDACDDVMRRVSKPEGLIRMTSHEALEKPEATWFSARVKAYGAVWVVLVTAVVTLIAIRPDLDVLILRQPGTLYATLDEGAVGNFYNVQVINRSNRAHTLEYSVVRPAGGTITALGPVGAVGPHGLIESRLLLRVPQTSLSGPTLPVRFEVRSNGELLETIDSSFLGPTQAP